MGVTTQVISATASSSERGTLPCFLVGCPSHRTQSSRNFSNMNLSQGLQFFTNCSSVDPFHGVQSCRNKLLWCGSPTGTQVLPGTCFSMGFPQGQGPFGHSPGVGSSMGCTWISAPLWTSLGCRGKAASPWAAPQAAGGSLLQSQDHLSLPFSLTQVICTLFFVYLTYSHFSLA